MIEEIFIDTLEDVMQLLMEQERNQDNHRYRSSFLYRGMIDANFHLCTSLSRNCKSKQWQLEPAILRNFVKYAEIVNPTLEQSVWKQMITGQHYGLPTRLLDWTPSPLIALHFANDVRTLDHLDNRDCLIWRIDGQDIKRGLPDRYRKALDEDDTFIFDVKKLTSVVDTLEQYDRDMADRSMMILEPPSTDQRIINQYSFFSVVPRGIEDVESYLAENTARTRKYIISRNIRWDIRDLLDQFNMNERIIYPGLDGLSKWIARYYFVRE